MSVIWNHIFLRNNTLKAMKVPNFHMSTPHSPQKESHLHLPENSLLLLHRRAASERCVVVALVALGRNEN